MPEKNEMRVEGRIVSAFDAATTRLAANTWTQKMKHKLGPPNTAEELTTFRIEAEDKVCETGNAHTRKFLEAYAATIHAEAFSAGSRATLAQLYKGCPDEATVIWIGQLMMRNPKLSPIQIETRDKAVANAREWAFRAGLEFAIHVKPELDEA